MSSGPLAGVRVLELAGRGPGPFGAMVLADLGAEVVRIVRPADVDPGGHESDVQRMASGHRQLDLVLRNRRSIALDLKHPDGVGAVLRLVEQADVLIEGNRPGVTERLGLGPADCQARNPRLVYARMTGWGQDGPMAQVPGHDINYVALSGALDPMRRPGEAPVPPLNLVGDYGGGGMVMVVGILAALQERHTSGRGQVIDAAMIDGIALLTTTIHALRAEGMWNDEPGSNVLDLAAPFYNVYETADGRYVTVGAGEPKFYAELIRIMGLPEELVRAQHDEASWPAAKRQLADAFRTRTFAEWRALLDASDSCFAPVLTLAEAPHHAHLRARGTFVEVEGVTQPAPAPRFDRTPGSISGLPRPAGADTREVLQDWGFGATDIDALIACGAARQARQPFLSS
ncbi:MAG TPA: CaiB/BaiF CoA-transferase family protein [Mycobacteriales bacterium]|nr:CaiB/BaiF CoA-transferase family protein [Mycobacteriales bacterium]